MSHAAAPSASSRRVRRRLIIVGSAVVALLLAGGISAAAAASSAQAEADQQARIAAADALVDAEYQTARATLTREDATAIVASGTTLVSDADKDALRQLAASLEDVTAETAKASPAEVTTSVDNARVELTRVLTAAIAASQAASDAAPLADATVRQALVDAQAALVAADGDERSVAEFVAGLSAAVDAVNESQQLAAAAKSAGTIKQRNSGGNDEGNTVGG